jgi:hypothetical protein
MGYMPARLSLFPDESQRGAGSKETVVVAQFPGSNRLSKFRGREKRISLQNSKLWQLVFFDKPGCGQSDLARVAPVYCSPNVSVRNNVRAAVVSRRWMRNRCRASSASSGNWAAGFLTWSGYPVRSRTTLDHLRRARKVMPAKALAGRIIEERGLNTDDAGSMNKGVGMALW